MNLNRMAMTGILSVLGVAGCAADPGTKVTSAEAALTSEQQKARSEEQSKNAEATRKQEAAHAEAAAAKTLATSEARKDVSAAQADLAQDRRDFDAKTTERLAKADAKAKELKTKSTKLTGKKAADFKGHFATFNTLRGEATSKVSNLGTSANSEWSAAKTDLERRLDGLESTLDSMAKDL